MDIRMPKKLNKDEARDILRHVIRVQRASQVLITSRCMSSDMLDYIKEIVQYGDVDMANVAYDHALWVYGVASYVIGAMPSISELTVDECQDILVQAINEDMKGD